MVTHWFNIQPIQLICDSHWSTSFPFTFRMHRSYLRFQTCFSICKAARNFKLLATAKLFIEKNVFQSLSTTTFTVSKVFSSCTFCTSLWNIFFFLLSSHFLLQWNLKLHLQQQYFNYSSHANDATQMWFILHCFHLFYPLKKFNEKIMENVLLLFSLKPAAEATAFHLILISSFHLQEHVFLIFL